MDGSGRTAPVKVRELIDRMEHSDKEEHEEKSPNREEDSSREDFTFRRSGLLARTPPPTRTSSCSGRIERLGETEKTGEKENKGIEQTKKRPRKEDCTEPGTIEVGKNRNEEQNSDIPEEVRKREGELGKDFIMKVKEFADTIITMTSRESGNKLAFGRTEQQKVRESTQYMLQETMTYTYKMGKLEEELTGLKQREEKKNRDLENMNKTLQHILDRLDKIEGTTSQVLGKLDKDTEDKTKHKQKDRQEKGHNVEIMTKDKDKSKPGPSVTTKEQIQRKEGIEPREKSYAEATRKSDAQAYKSGYEEDEEQKNTGWITPPKKSRRWETVVRINEEKEGTEKLKEVKEKLIKKGLGGKLKGINLTRGGGIIIESRDEKQQETVTNILKETSNFEVRKGREYLPTFTITGIHRGHENEEFIERFVDQNQEHLKEWTREHLIANLKIIGRKICINETRENIIIQTEPDIFRKIIRQTDMTYDLCDIYMLY